MVTATGSDSIPPFFSFLERRAINLVFSDSSLLFPFKGLGLRLKFNPHTHERGKTRARFVSSFPKKRWLADNYEVVERHAGVDVFSVHISRS